MTTAFLVPDWPPCPAVPDWAVELVTDLETDFGLRFLVKDERPA